MLRERVAVAVVTFWVLFALLFPVSATDVGKAAVGRPTGTIAEATVVGWAFYTARPWDPSRAPQDSVWTETETQWLQDGTSVVLTRYALGDFVEINNYTTETLLGALQYKAAGTTPVLNATSYHFKIAAGGTRIFTTRDTPSLFPVWTAFLYHATHVTGATTATIHLTGR